jgi:hypothetical protein
MEGGSSEFRYLKKLKWGEGASKKDERVSKNKAAGKCYE